MKKVGILTFHYTNNYGGVLQAIALQKIIENLGHDAEIINFIPAGYSPEEALFFKRVLKRDIRKLLKGSLDLSIFKADNWNLAEKRKHICVISEKTEEFRRENTRVSKRVNSNELDSILCQYDVLISGSDQIWNPSQRKKREYFLDFGEKYKGLKISYAADSTTADVSEEDYERCKKALDDFDYITVRNNHTKEFVKNLTGKDVPVVADPTLLFDFKAKKPEGCGEYILAYVIGSEIRGGHKKAIEKIQKTYGNMPVLLIKDYAVNSAPTDFADEVLSDVGPQEWLDLMKGASFVYTDSFHGTIFAIKSKKPFIAYYTETLRATRFLDMGQRYGIEKFIVGSVENIDVKNSLKLIPDYDLISSLLDEHKLESIQLLKNVLG